MNAFGLTVTPALLGLGAISGLTFGLLAVGLLLVYRSTRIINFAHGEIGALGAAVTGLLVVRWQVPYWLAMAGGMATAAAVAGLAEIIVIRRLRHVPQLMSMVATLGLAQLLLAVSATLNSKARLVSQFPQPPGMPQFNIGVLHVTRAYSAILILSPFVLLALLLFLTRTRYGLAIRAAASNPERALMAGISAARMSTLTWVLAGALSAFTVVLLLPTRGFITKETLGPTLLVRALVPAVLARMNSLPKAMAGGIAVGIIDQVLQFNFSGSGLIEMVLLIVIVIALLFQGRGSVRTQPRESWAALQPWRPIPDRLREVRSIRMLAPAITLLALAGAILAGLVATNSAAVTLSAIVVFALAGLSVGITTGLTGQLSLGQFAIAGVGTAASYITISLTGHTLLGIAVAAAAGALASMMLGLPAARIQGLLFAVVTLAFALAAYRWLFGQSWALGSGVSFPFAQIGPVKITSARGYYFWTLAVFCAVFLITRNVWRGGIGMRLRAVRDNEDALRAFAVSPTHVKMEGFAIGGALAGVAGALLGPSLALIEPSAFVVGNSISVITLTVLGGIGFVAGPVIGALYIVGLPRFVTLDNAGLMASSLGWLLLILNFPGGFAAIIAKPRQRLIAALAARAGLDTADTDEPDASASFRAAAPVLPPDRLPAQWSQPNHDLLVATGVCKSFGGVRAADSIDLVLHPGEILGLIGPNGAGKTTLFEMLAGFTTPDRGRIELAGCNITHLPAHERAELGLVRSFQEAALFDTLTVLETVTLAFERRWPTGYGSLLGIDRRLNAKRQHARELVALMGLDRFRDRQIRELSTGTRRITDLACIMALEPRVLLLDEPSSGIAQRETEALGELLLAIRASLDCALVIIEHDIPLLMGMADRVMAMDSGRVIANGTPEEVRNHPQVITSYLGGSIVAIERSGPVAAVALS